MARFLLCALLLVTAGGAAQAARTIEYVEGAYELGLADISLPASINGQLTFKACARCSSIALPVNTATQYSFGGTAQSLAEFTATIASLRAGGQDATGINVYYDLASKRVTRVIVPNPAL